MYRVLLLLTVLFAIGFQSTKPSPDSPDPNTPRPIAAVDSVFIEDLTWMEVRDAMKAGKNTVIVATGGVDLAPAEKAIEWGKKIVNYRADATVKAIRQAIEKKG